MSTEINSYLSSIQPKSDETVFTPSKYQQGVFDWIRSGKGHGMVNAVAGSGKSTTLVESVGACWETDPGKILFCVFGKENQIDLDGKIKKAIAKGKLPRGINVQAYTLNAFGWSEIVRKAMPYVKLDKYKDQNILRRIVNPDMESERYYRLQNPVLRMVSLIKNIMGNTRDYEKIAAEFGVELGELKPMDRFPEVLAEVYRRSVDDTAIMSFDDQIFQPIHRNMPIPQYRWVLMDEFQDVSPVQMELAKRLAQHGRLIMVGDPDQSIYLFRGAHPDAMGTVARDLSATQLPLSICYRCPKKVIESARKQCPRLEYPQDAPEGICEWITTEDFIEEVEPGDLVLSRTTAPLIKRCLQLIKMGVKAYVKGRDVGAGLVALIEKIHGNPIVLRDDYRAKFDQGVDPSHPSDIVDFLMQVDDYFRINAARLERAGRETELMSLEMNIECIKVLAEDADYAVEMIKRIEEIFSDTDDRTAVRFMTGHKCKGLENERVFILRLDLCPHPKAKTSNALRQEQNLLLVMKTRAMYNKKTGAVGELYFVQKEKDEK